MDGFKIAGSPGLSGVLPGNDTIKDYLSLFNNSFVGIFRCRFSDGTFFLINQGVLNILGIAAVATGLLYNRVTKDLFTAKATGNYGETIRTEPEYEHGFGLGLYLVKNIVDKMRGCITARSASGRGSEFIVKIPDATRYAGS